MGFIIDRRRGETWIDAETQRNAEVLFPYLNGEDMNSRPDCSASRWVIDFSTAIEQAAQLSPTAVRARVQQFVQAGARREQSRKAREKELVAIR